MDIVSVAGSLHTLTEVQPHLALGTLGDWCVYDGTAWTRVPATNAGVTSVTTTDGTYIDLTPACPSIGNRCCNRYS